MTLRQYNIIVNRFSDNIFRFILKNLSDRALAEDFTQDTFSILWIHHKDVDFEKAKAYLFKTAFNLVIDNSRRQKTRLKYQSEQAFLSNQESFSHDHDHFELQEILQEAVNQLPPQQKAVITLRDLEGYSYKEIEDITHLNQSQVKVYIYRGRLFLKQYLEALDYQPK